MTAAPASLRQQARFAGLLYLLLALSAPFGLLYVPAEVIVPGDATQTAMHLRSSTGLVRLGIASELLHQVIAVFLVLALYRLLKPVDERLSRQLVVFGALLSVPIVFVNVLNDLAALTFVSDATWLGAFTSAQLDALAYFFITLHGEGITVASVFWGLWLIPFGLLVMRCGFIPPVFGVLLLAAGTGYLVTAIARLVFPAHADTVSMLAAPLQFGELPIIGWLLLRGARSPRTA
ncbi:DUF4386 domain-containing protein [soil metagenome]